MHIPILKGDRLLIAIIIEAIPIKPPANQLTTHHPPIKRGVGAENKAPRQIRTAPKVARARGWLNFIGIRIPVSVLQTWLHNMDGQINGQHEAKWARSFGPLPLAPTLRIEQISKCAQQFSLVAAFERDDGL